MMAALQPYTKHSKENLPCFTTGEARNTNECNKIKTQLT